MQITRTSVPPKIDGTLNDEAWKSAKIATKFVEFKPEIGNIPSKEQRTEVKVTYDDQAIYVSAYLYDDPKLIMKQITSRDNFGQSDFFMVVLNPNNDSQNDTYFVVFSSGQQADAIANPSIGEDFSWNSVWFTGFQPAHGTW